MQRNMNLIDAQTAMSFAVQQATLIHPRVYEKVYGNIDYRGLVPVDTTGPEWLKSVTYFSTDALGQADWVSGSADDIPLVDLNQSKTETNVAMAGIGYGWTLEELSQAQLLGFPLTDRKAKMARRASEEHIDKMAFSGDTRLGYYGIINHPSVAVIDAAATGTGSSTFWKDKTPDQILADINSMLAGQFTNSRGAEMVDTLLLPYSVLHDIGTRRLSDYDTTTILEWIKSNNVFTMQTGRALTIRGRFDFNTAGDGGTTRMVAYRNDEEVFRLNMPMPYRFLPVWQSGPMRWEVPGIFRLGGVDVSLPEAMRYMDGI